MSSSETQATTTTTTTSTLPSNPETTNANPGFNPTQSSTLYLFTFLATLLLLLAVSCAIVIRSFILRRRFRRRIEEAIAAGVLIPGALDDSTIGGMGRSRRRDFGEKPKLWEVWIDDLGHSDRSSHFERDSFGKDEGRWEDIMPVSAMMLHPEPAANSPSTGENDMPASSVEDLRISFISRLFGRYPGSTTTVSSVRNGNVSQDDMSSANIGLKEQVSDGERLQVAVLISMPNAHSPKWENNDSPKGKARGLNNLGEVGGEREIPDVVFGATSVRYRM